MSKQSLNDRQFINKAFDAIASGDSSQIDDLMGEDTTEIKDIPDLEGNDEDDDEILDTKDVDVDDDSADEPAAKDGDEPEKAGAKPSKGSAPPKEEDPNAWIEKLPAELKDKVLGQLNNLSSENNRLQQYYKSNEGRVSGLHKKITGLERELESRKTQPPVKAAASDLNLEDDETLAQLKEDDPALYRVLKQREDRLLKTASDLVGKLENKLNSTLEERIAPLHKTQEDNYIAQQQDIVLATVTNAADVVNSDDWKRFEQIASPGVKALINSAEASDLIEAFHVYSRWLGPVAGQKEDVAPAAKPDSTSDNKTAAAVAEARKRKLDAGTVGSKDLSSPRGELDETRLLEQMFQEIMVAEGHTRSK